jgi:hypothetical protein
LASEVVESFVDFSETFFPDSLKSLCSFPALTNYYFCCGIEIGFLIWFHSFGANIFLIKTI